MRRNWIEGKDDKSMYMYTVLDRVWVTKSSTSLISPDVVDTALVTFFQSGNQQFRWGKKKERRNNTLIERGL